MALRPYLPDQHQGDAFRALRGLVRLHRYRALMAEWPTVAIGGISEERVAAVKGQGRQHRAGLGHHGERRLAGRPNGCWRSGRRG